MPESTAAWSAKTLALVLVVAVLTALVTTGVQLLIWKKSNGAVSGGAATGVCVAYMMSRRNRRMQEIAASSDQPKT